MLDQAKKVYHSDRIRFIQMEAQKLEFPNESFDLVIANLILSVVPSPEQCLQEMIRATRKGGELLIFDKFSPSNNELPKIKKMLRPLIRMFGTDIGLRFEQIAHPFLTYIDVKENSAVLFNGMYRKILLHKREY